MAISPSLVLLAFLPARPCQSKGGKESQVRFAARPSEGYQEIQTRNIGIPGIGLPWLPSDIGRIRDSGLEANLIGREFHEY